MKKIKAGIDENFLCSCGGTWVPDPALAQNGRNGFRCSVCGKTGPQECPVCHNPRGIFMRSGECALCGSKLKEGFTKIFQMLIAPD